MRMIPAHAVPWPTTSPSVSSSTSGLALLARSRRPSRRRSAADQRVVGLDAAVEDADADALARPRRPTAHSRVTSSGQRIWMRMRSVSPAAGSTRGAGPCPSRARQACRARRPPADPTGASAVRSSRARAASSADSASAARRDDAVVVGRSSSGSPRRGAPPPVPRRRRAAPRRSRPAAAPARRSARPRRPGSATSAAAAAIRSGTSAASVERRHDRVVARPPGRA